MKSFPRPLKPVPSSPRASHLAAAIAVAGAVLFAAGCQRQETVCRSCCDTNEAAAPDLTPLPAGAASSNGATNDAGQIFASEWLPPERRVPIPLTHEFTRHDGKAVQLNELIGKPVAISFAYTRCTNPNKCRLVTTTMGTLRTKLASAGLLDKVRLALITYDAEYDSPKIMSDYAARNGLELDEQSMFLRPAADPAHRLFRDLKVNAAFNPSGVTMHGIQLLLLDKSGRLARTYRTLIWENDQVVNDLVRLANE